jgi:hypothetical protein
MSVVMVDTGNQALGVPLARFPLIFQVGMITNWCGSLDTTVWSRVGLMATLHNMHGMHIVVDCGGCPLDLCMLHNGPKCRIYYIMSDGSVEVFLLYHRR